MNNLDYYNHFYPVDEYGNSVEKTKDKYPYSYDGFVTYRNGENKEVNSTVYTDRLLQWDYEKTRKLIKKHFPNNLGDYWNTREPKQIEKFLQDWLGDKKLKLILVMEYCNVHNGYPVWRFDFKTSK